MPIYTLRIILRPKGLRLLAVLFKSQSVDQMTFCRVAVAVRGQSLEDNQGSLQKLMEFYRKMEVARASSLVNKWRRVRRASNKTGGRRVRRAQ